MPRWTVLWLSLALVAGLGAPVGAEAPNAAIQYKAAVAQAHVGDIHEDDVNTALSTGYHQKVSLDESLDAHQAAFGALRQGLRIDRCRFVPETGIMGKTAFGPYEDLQKLTLLFFADGLRQYAKGHPDDAIETMLGAIKIGVQMQQDGVLAARAKGLELQEGTFLAYMKWLQREAPAADVLKRHIATASALLKLHVPFNQTIAIDRKWAEASAMDLAASGDSRAFRGLTATQEGQVLASFKRQADRSYAALQQSAGATDFVSLPRTEVMLLKHNEIDKHAALTPETIATVLLQQLVPSFSKPWFDDQVGQVELAALPALMAAKSWHASHHAWPRSLSQLVPQYLAAVPQDLFSKAPLKYKVVGSSCVIYSVGPDHHDDGGKHELTDYGKFKGTDIVMRLP